MDKAMTTEMDGDRTCMRCLGPIDDSDDNKGLVVGMFTDKGTIRNTYIHIGCEYGEDYSGE